MSTRGIVASCGGLQTRVGGVRVRRGDVGAPEGLGETSQTPPAGTSLTAYLPRSKEGVMLKTLFPKVFAGIAIVEAELDGVFSKRLKEIKS